MNCTEFELLTNDRLDARQTALSAESRAHLAECAACRSFWRGQVTLLSAVDSWKDVAPPSRVIDAALRELVDQNGVAPQHVAVSASSVPPRRSIAGVWGLVCSTAALALLAVLVVRPSPPAPAQPLPVVQVEPAAPAETANVSEALSGLLHDVRSEYAEISRETTRVLADLGDLPEAGPWFAPIAASDEERPESASAWMRLDRPVSDRVGEAFDFLWDALPREAPPL